MSRAIMEMEDALKYQGKLFGNVQVAMMLDSRARQVLNSSPEPAHEIVVERLQQDMAEKERVGLTFNRTVAESMAERWSYLENLNAQFLQDVVNMEDQIKDDCSKCDRELKAFLADRAHLFILKSQCEQMEGMAMHVNFYKRVIVMKIKSLTTSARFLKKCTESLGFSHPAQVIDRYESLKNIFEELFNEFEQRANVLNALQEEYNSAVDSCIKQNILDHISMAEMNDELKNINNENYGRKFGNPQNTKMENFLRAKLEYASDRDVIGYKVKVSIHQIYRRLMEYRGQEPVETASLAQLAELEARMQLLESVVKIVQDDIMNDFRKAKKKQTKKKRKLEIIEPSASVSTEPSSVQNTPDTSSDFNFELDKEFELDGKLQGQKPETSRKEQRSFLITYKEAEVARNSMVHVRHSKSDVVHKSSEVAKSTREKKGLESTLGGIRAKSQDSSRTLISFIEELDPILGQPTGRISINNNRLNRSNSRKSELENVAHKSFGCLRDGNSSKNTALKNRKHFNWSTAKIDHKNKEFANSIHRNSKESPISKSKIPFYSLTCQQIKTCDRPELRNHHLEKKSNMAEHKGDQSANKGNPIFPDSKDSRVVIKQTESTVDTSRDRARKLLDNQNRDKILQISKLPIRAEATSGMDLTNTVVRPEGPSRCSGIATSNGKDRSENRSASRPSVTHALGQSKEKITNGSQENCYWQQTESTRDRKIAEFKPRVTQRNRVSHRHSLLSARSKLITKQHSATMRRFSLITGNTKMIGSSAVGPSRERNQSFKKLETVKAEPIRSLQDSKLTEKRHSNSYFPSLVSANNKKESLHKSYNAASLPDLSHQKKSFVDCSSVSNKRPTLRSTLESRRLLGELCASRRSLRDNCLSLLASVKLHSQRPAQMDKHDDS